MCWQATSGGATDERAHAQAKKTLWGESYKHTLANACISRDYHFTLVFHAVHSARCPLFHYVCGIPLDTIGSLLRRAIWGKADGSKNLGLWLCGYCQNVHAFAGLTRGLRRSDAGGLLLLLQKASFTAHCWRYDD